MPVPVWAMPTQSRPFKRIGQSWAWIGVALTKFCRLHSSSISGWEANACLMVLTGFGFLPNKWSSFSSGSFRPLLWLGPLSRRPPISWTRRLWCWSLFGTLWPRRASFLWFRNTQRRSLWSRLGGLWIESGEIIPTFGIRIFKIFFLKIWARLISQLLG